MSPRVGSDSVEWRDLQIELRDVKQLPEGFIALADGEGGKQIMCKLPPRFRPASVTSYSVVRLLNVGLAHDGDGLRVVWSKFSEVFWEPSRVLNR